MAVCHSCGRLSFCVSHSRHEQQQTSWRADRPVDTGRNHLPRQHVRNAGLVWSERPSMARPAELCVFLAPGIVDLSAGNYRLGLRQYV